MRTRGIAPDYRQSFALGFFERFQLAEDERAGGERCRRKGDGTAGTGPVNVHAEVHVRSRWRRRGPPTQSPALLGPLETTLNPPFNEAVESAPTHTSNASVSWTHALALVLQ